MAFFNTKRNKKMTTYNYDNHKILSDGNVIAVIPEGCILDHEAFTKLFMDANSTGSNEGLVDMINDAISTLDDLKSEIEGARGDASDLEDSASDLVYRIGELKDEANNARSTLNRALHELGEAE